MNYYSINEKLENGIGISEEELIFWKEQRLALKNKQALQEAKDKENAKQRALIEEEQKRFAQEQANDLFVNGRKGRA